ncbi:Ap4A phosphorylase II [Marinobacterium lacunae]|uniref:Ap4A phosphorylase II n=1 Tax=Marinobacterium lacunae TaxID=1232683 RepID=A0A081FUF0_9GAMM|nr:DUF4922 domain-containing protein [Marinobacterium lacunae]KEA62155.1 Ap4A phosphorylase II [Marinobacterium lacunae]
MVKLADRVEAVTQAALANGALQSIQTVAEVVNEGEISYLIRVLDNLKRKDEARARLKKAASHASNPFLPYEEALYVCELGEHHRCLLNKYNVVDKHLLIVTSRFEPQSDRLNLNDFRALSQVMAEIPGLAFFNGGEQAGASQPHKHLQLVPLPMSPFAETPFSEQLNHVSGEHPQGCEALGFRHCVMQLPSALFEDAAQAGQQLLAAYESLRDALNLADDAPYNLLLTRHWMMMVPRRAERWQSISFNALAFCGAILVRDEEQAAKLKEEGIMRALVSVA